jgi:hypothetical protein
MQSVRAISAALTDVVLAGTLGAANASVVKLALLTARPAFEHYAGRVLTRRAWSGIMPATLPAHRETMP